MAIKRKLSDYVPRRDATATLDQATDEVRRELSVRKRLYDRWIQDGNMTFSEADGRMRAMMTALAVLLALDAAHPVPAVECDPMEGGM